MAGLKSLRLRQSEAFERCYRLCWVPQQLWQRLEASKDEVLCFDGLQSVSDREPWHLLELLAQGAVPCLLDFDARIARQAVDLQGLKEGLQEPRELLLPPFLRASLGQVRRQKAPPPYHMEVFRVELRGFPETETSEELLQSPPEAVLILPLKTLSLKCIESSREAILAASLLLSLQSSGERSEGGLELLASECFAQLAELLQAQDVSQLFHAVNCFNLL